MQKHKNIKLHINKDYLLKSRKSFGIKDAFEIHFPHRVLERKEEKRKQNTFSIENE